MEYMSWNDSLNTQTSNDDQQIEGNDGLCKNGDTAVKQREETGGKPHGFAMRANSSNILDEADEAKTKSNTLSSPKGKCYKCSDCEKSFGKPSSLKLHSAVHSEERPFKCHQCDKGFKTPDKLRRHSSTVHSNGKALQCDQCGEYFKTRETLANHQVVHSEERPFKCSQCDKSFKRFADVKEHEKTHTERERPFKCSQCESTFMTAKNLK